MTMTEIPSTRGWSLTRGATPLPGERVAFRVWAPLARRVRVKIHSAVPRELALADDGDGFHAGVMDGVASGDLYSYVLEGEGGTKERPDPTSRFQPLGVHGPSAVVDPEEFRWSDRMWKGIPLKDLVLYELHIGCFTPQGTFEAAIEKLDHLVHTGITAVEIMPVAAFPGERNWGYDGVHLYAPQASYGGPAGLKKLVDACHARGLAVILDVVYNHLGPEGNYLHDFGPYFTDRYRSPWGWAINFDGEGSDPVREHFLDNALHWLTEYHVDGLRLDAVHGILDMSAIHLLDEMQQRFQRQASVLGRQAWLIAESDLNDPRLLEPEEVGGRGLDAQWADDFHHSVLSLVSGARTGYLGDFGHVADLAKALAEGFVYDGRYQPTRRRRHGRSAAHLPGERFVYFIQNHDQVANTCRGTRLPRLTSLEHHRVAAMILLTAPGVPLLFMGEEYAEVAPFHYFTSHGDPALAEAVSKGRRQEHADFLGEGELFHDPQDPLTFQLSKLDWSRLGQTVHQGMLAFYRDLLALRREVPALGAGRRDRLSVVYDEDERWLAVSREEHVILVNLSEEEQAIPLEPGRWTRRIDTNDPRYGALLGSDRAAGFLEPSPGGHEAPTAILPPCSAAVYARS